MTETTDRKPTTGGSSPAAYLDMPPERHEAATVHAAALAETAAKIALTLPLAADVDDFRRVLDEEVRP